MASVKICDGRSVLYQYDTKVTIELCDCRNFTECHFVTDNGVIRREVENNICSVPDAALLYAGTLTVYAFSRKDDGGQTQHSFFIGVRERPKPADYVDPPDETDNVDALCERLLPKLAGGVTEEQLETVVANYLTKNPQGVPEGGKAGQYLRKKSDNDRDVEWADFEIPQEYGHVAYGQDKTITIT